MKLSTKFLILIAPGILNNTIMLGNAENSLDYDELVTV